MGSFNRKLRRIRELADPNSQRTLDKFAQQVAELEDKARAAGMEPKHIQDTFLIYAARIAAEANLTEREFSTEAVNALVRERRELERERSEDE